MKTYLHRPIKILQFFTPWRIKKCFSRTYHKGFFTCYFCSNYSSMILRRTVTDSRKLFVTSKNYLKILRIFLDFRGVFNNFKNYLRVLRTPQQNIVEKKSNNVGKQCPFTSIIEKRVLSMNYCKDDYNGSMTNTQCLRENLCYQYFFSTIGS